MDTSSLTEKQKDNLIRRWGEFLKSSKANKHYAIQRIDLLIIAISSFGVLFCLESVRFFKEHTEEVMDCKGILTVSIFSFTIAIVVNFFSQFTGYWANRHAEIKASQKLRQLNEEKSFSQKEYNNSECYQKIYNKLTDIFNIASAVLMFTGMVLCCVFYMCNFN